MNKTLTLAVATLTLGAVAASAAISAITVVDTPYSATIDPVATPAYHVNGTWTPMLDGDWTVAPGINWTARLDGSKKTIGLVDIFILQVDSTHLVGPPALNFVAALGMADIAGNAGTITSYIDHTPPGPGDAWRFEANIGPAGTMNYDLYAAHVPEPGSFALIAGLGLVGFAAYRRVRA